MDRTREGYKSISSNNYGSYRKDRPKGMDMGVELPVLRLKASLTMEAALILPIVSSVLMIILLVGMYVADVYRIHAVADAFNTQMTQSLKAYDTSQWQASVEKRLQHKIHARDLLMHRIETESKLSQEWEEQFEQSLEGKLLLKYQHSAEVTIQQAVVGTIVRVDIFYDLQLGSLSKLLRLFSLEGIQHIHVARKRVIVDREEMHRMLVIGKELVKNTKELVE